MGIIVLMTATTTLSTGETAIRNRLIGLGHTVVNRTHSEVEYTGAYDGFVIAENVSSTTAGTKYRSVAKPGVVMEGGLWDDHWLSGATSSTPTLTQWDMLSVPPLNAGLTGVTTVSASGNYHAATSSGAGTGAQIFARHPTTSTSIIGWAYETGATLVTGTAPARRVALGILDASVALVIANANGAAILDAVFNWVFTPPVVAPIVGAGTDATIDQYDTFARTATENAGGGTITARTWTVFSGPNQVGATIGTAAVLSWAPTVGGTYVLRYSATNSAGTGTDDVQVTVSALNFPVTAALRLSATRIGAKRVASAPTAPLFLTATQVGAKRIASSPVAPLVLSASAEGQRINLVVAALRLSAALINAGSSNQAFATAALRLAASTSDRSSVHTGGPVTAPLRLAASSVGISSRSGGVSGNLALAAGLSVGAKNIAVTRSAPIRIAASIAAVQHATPAAPIAALRLAASTSARSTTRTGYPVTAPLRLTGIPTARHSVHFGSTVGAILRLHAQASVQRLVAEITAIVPRADTLVKYDLVCVARVPQVSGPPIFLEVDPIDWTSITHTEALNEAPSLSAAAKVESLTEPVLQRMQAPHELPTELWLYRNGKLVFAGPLVIGRNATDQITFEALGIAAYTRMWHLTSDLVFADVDQFTIVKALIDQWQNLEYGHYGIDTSGIGVSGVLRSMIYLYTEPHVVADRIDDLTKAADGFDWRVDPASRTLELHHPSLGIDRSTGEDAIIFDARNVTSADVAFSVAPGDLASDGLATANAVQSGGTAPLVATYANSELRSRFGRVGVTANFQVADQAALDASVQSLVATRSSALLVPGPNARVTLDSDPGDYDPGDIVGYRAHTRLSASGAYRIRKRVISVTQTGTESVSLEFV